MVNNSIFVNRERELKNLRKISKEVKEGSGRVVLVEGSAGMGKSTLLEKFKGEVNFEIIEGKATQDTRYIPYELFSRALKHFGTLKDIMFREEMRKIREMAENLVKNPGVVFVDEIGKGGGYLLYREIRKKLKGIYFSNLLPEEDGVWLTNISMGGRIAKPSSVEFSILPLIYDFTKGDEKKVIYIEDINYLLYVNGARETIELLNSLHELSRKGHVVIFSGKIEHLKDDEKNSIFTYVDDRITVEWKEERKNNNLHIVNEPKDGIKFSSRRGSGDYLVARGYLNPERIDFELFERIVDEMKKGNNILLDCVGQVIHYNGIRKVYTWLKDLSDYAIKYGVNVYVLAKDLSETQIEILRNIADFTELSEDINPRTIEKDKAIKFYDAVFNFLHYESLQKPIMIILENIQWADKSSLSLLNYLVRNIMKSRIMLIITYRNEDIVGEKNTKEIIGDIQKLENCEILRLKPLSQKSLREMFPDFNDKNFHLIYKKSEGNPLLAKTIAESIGKGEEILPESIRESIEMQIDALDDFTLYFLRFVSVMGESVSMDILKELYPNYEVPLKKLRNRILKIVGDRVVFMYSIYRDIVYHGISKDLRIEFHREIGEFMERRGNFLKASHHYYMAGDRRALKFLKRSAEEAIKLLAIRNAIDYYEKALEIARKYKVKNELVAIYEKLGDYYTILAEYQMAIEMYQKSIGAGNEKVIEIGAKIGECYTYLGNYDDALKILKKYLPKAKGLERARITGQIGVVNQRRGNFEEALRDMEEYLKYAQKYHSREDIARAYQNIAVIYYYRNDYEKCLEYGKKAIEVASQVHDYRTLIIAYNIIGVANDSLYRHDEALVYYRRCVEIAEKIGNFDYISRAYNNMAIVYDAIGDIERAKEYYSKVLDISLKIGNKRMISIYYNNLSTIECEAGDYMKCVEYMEKSRKYAEEVGDKYGICWDYKELGSAYLGLRYYDKARENIEMAIKIAEAEGYENLKISAYLIYGMLLMKRENYEDAREYIVKAEKLLGNVKDISLKLTYLETAVEYYFAMKDIDNAEKYVSELMTLVNDIGEISEKMLATQYLAKLKCVKNDMKGAVEEYRKIISYFEKTGKRAFLADMLMEYGKCLYRKNTQEAIESFKGAKKIYEDMNLHNKAIEVEDEISKSQSFK